MYLTIFSKTVPIVQIAPSGVLMGGLSPKCTAKNITTQNTTAAFTRKYYYNINDRERLACQTTSVLPSLPNVASYLPALYIKKSETDSKNNE